MELRRDFSLQPYNTFGLSVSAEYFTSAADTGELQEALQFAREKGLTVLGGGSNILLTRNVPGLTLRIGLLGIEQVGEDSEFYYIRSAAGESWHKLVMYCVERGFGGIENLSLIPGSAGAAPMQNIGAYGVELKDVFEELEALNIHTKEKHIFRLEDCDFGYRSSVFKTTEKGNYIILSLTLKLRKKPEFSTTYGAITQELEKMGVTELSVKAISDAVINIRRSKLPDPAEIGNAGSFFKNPVIGKAEFDRLKKMYPDVVHYTQPGGEEKLAAGWLIEKAGWKGKTFGNYGVHKNQALVLVNYGGASGSDIYRLSEDIIHDIREKFGVQLEREVNVI